MAKYQKYAEYKDSGVEWLGKIPSHWKVTRLKFLAKIKNGQDYKHVEAENGFPVMGSGGQFTFSTEFMFDQPSVLLGRKGTIDKPLFIDEPFWTVDTMYYTDVQKDIDVKYFYYLAKTILFDRYSTNTALPSMTQENLNNFEFSIPCDFDERLAIRKFLDYETAKIDTLIAKQEKLIELLKEKRQAVISHAVTKGLNPNVPMKDSGVEWLGEVPEHWEVIKFDYVINTVGDIDHYMPSSVDIGIPYVMTGDLQDFVSDIDFENCKKVAYSDYQKLSRKIKTAKDDIIFARYATIGTLSYVDIDAEFLVSYSCVTIKPNPQRITGKYLFYYLKSQAFLQAIQQQINSNTQGNVGVDSLRNVRILLPSVFEQEQIIEVLKNELIKMDNLIAKSQSAIQLMQERRTALISAAVTGKIDVRHWQHPNQKNNNNTELSA